MYRLVLGLLSSLLLCTAVCAQDSTPQPSAFDTAAIERPTAVESGLLEELFRCCPPHVLRRIGLLTKALSNPRYAKQAPHAVLLVGEPGVGKTTLARAIAIMSGRPSQVILASALANEYQNSGSKNLERAVQHIMEGDQHYIIVIDEVMELMDQTQDKEKAQKSTAGRLLQLIDECINKKDAHITIIATANDITAMPSALKSRFQGWMLEIPVPDKAARARILKYHIAKNHYSSDDAAIQTIADATNGCSGRILRDVASVSTLYAMDTQRVGLVHLRQAMKDLEIHHPFWSGIKYVLKNKKDILKNGGPYIFQVSLFVVALCAQICLQQRPAPVHA